MNAGTIGSITYYIQNVYKIFKNQKIPRTFFNYIL